MERYRIVENEFGTSLIQAVTKHRFLFWTWETIRWFAGTGNPSKDQIGKNLNRKIVDGENKIWAIKSSSHTVTYDPIAERSRREAQP